MKVLKIVGPIVAVVVFIGAAVVLGRQSAFSRIESIKKASSSVVNQSTQYMKSNSDPDALIDDEPTPKPAFTGQSAGVPITSDSPTGCRAAIMRGVISRYGIGANETNVDRVDKRFGRLNVRNDGNVKATSLAKRLNIPYEEVVADLWNVRMDTFDGWGLDPKLKYAFEGKEIPMQSVSGTVYRFLGIDNTNCTLHFEQFEWNSSLYSMMYPVDFVEYGTHLRQFVN